MLTMTTLSALVSWLLQPAACEVSKSVEVLFMHVLLGCRLDVLALFEVDDAALKPDELGINVFLIRLCDFDGLQGLLHKLVQPRVGGDIVVDRRMP